MEDPPDRNRQLAEFERAERSLLKRAVEILRLQDLMMVVMVAATILAAIAAWRSALISRQILRSEYRPYVGVQKMTLDLRDRQKPQVVIEIHDFGDIPAERMVLSVSKTIDGKPVPDLEGAPEVTVPVGILSPKAADEFGSFFPAEYLQPILDGKSQLHVRVQIFYQDAAKNHYCYQETFGFFAPTGHFSPAFGTTDCSR